MKKKHFGFLKALCGEQPTESLLGLMLTEWSINVTCPKCIAMLEKIRTEYQASLLVEPIEPEALLN